MSSSQEAGVNHMGEWVERLDRVLREAGDKAIADYNNQAASEGQPPLTAGHEGLVRGSVAAGFAHIATRLDEEDLANLWVSLIWKIGAEK